MKKTLIVLSHLRWGFVYQRPQHIMSRLACSHRVVFVEEPVFHDGPAHWVASEPVPGVEVLCPHTPLPAHGFDDAQLPVLQDLLATWLREEGVERPLVWLYTPMALPLAQTVSAEAVVYDCMDELSAFAGAPASLVGREHALMEVADLVLTGGPSLYAARQDAHANVHCLPSAVDADHFAPSRLSSASTEHQLVQAQFADIGHPRLGFFGVIDERMDLALVRDLAAARPDWQWIMAGPVVKIDPATLPQAPNLHWIGMQRYATLPHLAAAWDVCTMPFALNESTRFISPTKTLEYLAAEKPVVSTPVNDVVKLYSALVKVAATAPEFIAHCAAALEETSAARQQRLAASATLLQQMSWDQTVSTIERQLRRLNRTVPALPVPDVQTRDHAVSSAKQQGQVVTHSAI